ncbi:alanine-glyoxylate transaminase/serine-glyoxylate transaminase/serine-pyruvate transaminase [Rhodobacteraceae bacterium MBR-64]|jgi:alanine-glyoxylate transaminase/serine-glyoxylate transaminase/serine-pyruvate transaminase
MTLANGRPYLAIPGPSTMPDRVLAAMHRPAPNIYAGALHEMVAGLIPDLRAVARTRQHVAMYIGNGHAAWEAANANVFSRGDRALVLATGRFGLGWADAARRMGVAVEVMDFGRQSPADPAQLHAALAADTAQTIRAILVTHTDTASTVRNDIPALRAAIDAAGHPALLMVDCIASLGCDRFEMDAWGVDVMIAASQKGLMVPPGLGFVWFSDKALECGKAADLRSPYWDWTPRAFPQEFYQHFCGTAPTHHLFGLREALTMLVHEEGLEAAWDRHARLARAVWAAVETWGQGGPMRLNVADPAFRSHSVTSVRIGAPDGTRLRDWTEHEAGVILGIGLGMADANDPAWHGFFRIAHMGHVNAHMTLGALAVIEAGLQALDIPHGPGAMDMAAAALR